LKQLSDQKVRFVCQMNLLKIEIDRKRKEKQELEEKLAQEKLKRVLSTDDTNSESNIELPSKENSEHFSKKKKFIKRGEIEKIKEKEYLERMEKERQVKQAKNKVEEVVKENSEVKNEDEESPMLLRLPLSEIMRRLRARGQPVTFFGETDAQRALRLQKLEEREPEPQEYVADGGQNDLGKSLRELEREETTGNQTKKDEDDEIEPDTKGDFSVKTKESYILSFLKKLISEWSNVLKERSEIQKRSAQGKIEMATFLQTNQYIKPLLKLLKSRTLSDDLLLPIHEICMFMEQREYVKAHDIYLRMSIGNAPWPMGVTMVGIHERSAREKIFSNQIAHVLNDETQRKYIQSLKRLMTFCQKRYPTDPSKTVG